MTVRDVDILRQLTLGNPVFCFKLSSNSWDWLVQHNLIWNLSSWLKIKAPLYNTMRKLCMEWISIKKWGGGGNFDEALHMTQQEWSNLSSFKLSKITYRNNLAKISFSAIKRHLSCCFLVLVKNQICWKEYYKCWCPWHLSAKKCNNFLIFGYRLQAQNKEVCFQELHCM